MRLGGVNDKIASVMPIRSNPRRMNQAKVALLSVPTTRGPIRYGIR